MAQRGFHACANSTKQAAGLFQRPAACSFICLYCSFYACFFLWLRPLPQASPAMAIARPTTAAGTTANVNAASPVFTVVEADSPPEVPLGSFPALGETASPALGSASPLEPNGLSPASGPISLSAELSGTTTHLLVNVKAVDAVKGDSKHTTVSFPFPSSVTLNLTVFVSGSFTTPGTDPLSVTLYLNTWERDHPAFSAESESTSRALFRSWRENVMNPNSIRPHCPFPASVDSGIGAAISFVDIENRNFPSISTREAPSSTCKSFVPAKNTVTGSPVEYVLSKRSSPTVWKLAESAPFPSSLTVITKETGAVCGVTPTSLNPLVFSCTR